MIAASAITMPILPAAVPNSVATREIFSPQDPGDDEHQVFPVTEHDRRFYDLPLAFDVDRVGTVHHDLVDLGVLQEDIQRAKPEDLRLHQGLQCLTVASRQGQFLLADDILHHSVQHLPGCVISHHVNPRSNLLAEILADTLHQTPSGILREELECRSWSPSPLAARLGLRLGLAVDPSSH